MPNDQNNEVEAVKSTTKNVDRKDHSECVLDISSAFECQSARARRWNLRLLVPVRELTKAESSFLTSFMNERSGEFLEDSEAESDTFVSEGIMVLTFSNQKELKDRAIVKDRKAALRVLSIRERHLIGWFEETVSSVLANVKVEAEKMEKRDNDIKEVLRVVNAVTNSNFIKAMESVNYASELKDLNLRLSAAISLLCAESVDLVDFGLELEKKPSILVEDSAVSMITEVAIDNNFKPNTKERSESFLEVAVRHIDKFSK